MRPPSSLPLDLASALAALGRLAAESGTAVYLVGGVVRDRLLRRPIQDVDLAVEGDAIALAGAAAEALGAGLRAHQAFGTAVLTLEGGRRLDLAATRDEVYPAPAALPEVRPAPLADDLRRRDFTVNSMALPLRQLDGSPIDPYDGARDLEARRLRVHHERSFLDDPTRIVRGVRFEARLGFRFEAETEALARQACGAGVVARLSAARLRRELGLLFAETIDLERAWGRLEELGLAGAAGLGGGAEAADGLARVARAVMSWPERHGRGGVPERSKALLGALVATLPAASRGAAAERLGISGAAVERLDELTDELGRAGLAPHRAAALLEPLALEELVLVEALGGDEAARRVGVHLTVQRELTLSVDGHQLLAHGAPPGPGIGAALRATREARLDGRISAEEELEFALAALGGENRR